MENKLTIKKIIEVYESIQGTGNTNYQNRFYFKQLRRIKKAYGKLAN